MTAIVEAVARAIYEGRNGPGCKPWNILTKAHQTPYLQDARNSLRTTSKQIIDQMDERLTEARAEFKRGFPDEDCSTINSTLAYGRIQGFENARAMLDKAIQDVGETK